MSESQQILAFLSENEGSKQFLKKHTKYEAFWKIADLVSMWMWP